MKYVSESESDTYKIAADFAATLSGGEIVLLSGELGAGKTAFVKGLAAALGIDDEVTSPTFTLMNVYYGSLTLYHFDVYRLNSGEEAYAAGLTEYFGEPGSVACIEWWENVREAIVGNAIKITINYLDNERREINIER